MNKIAKVMLPIIALTFAATVTNAQTNHQFKPAGETAANSEIDHKFPHLIGTVVGVISGPYGSILFVELENKTKLRFYHPGSSGNRGDRVLVVEKKGEYFLVEAATPRD